jgi:hypothetical protein
MADLFQPMARAAGGDDIRKLRRCIQHLIKAIGQGNFVDFIS